MTTGQNKAYLAQNDQQQIEPLHPRGNQWTRQSIGAICGLSFGMITCLVGCVMTALAWVSSDSESVYLGRVGTILLFLTIPSLVIGAHCLDLAERKPAGNAHVNTKSLSVNNKG
jgi:hypothetical protein